MFGAVCLAIDTAGFWYGGSPHWASNRQCRHRKSERGAIFHTTFHQFLCNESGTGTAEVIIDGFTACGTVGSADDLNFQAIFLGDACYFVEIDELVTC